MYTKYCLREFLVLTVLVAGSSEVTAADNAGGWYVMPSYHQTGLEKSSSTLKQPGGDIHFDTSFGDDTGPGLAIGYAFGAPYRIDVDYQSQSNDLKNSLGPDETIKVKTFVANVWRDFGPWYHLRPYVGLGFGGGTLKLNDLDGDVYFGQLGAGFEWFFMKRAALDVEYRYQLATSNPELTGNGQKLDIEYASQSMQIGVRINVWGF
jgi:opacity protein-like surface antigen